jgi:hypothetical protein
MVVNRLGLVIATTAEGEGVMPTFTIVKQYLVPV